MTNQKRFPPFSIGFDPQGLFNNSEYVGRFRRRAANYTYAVDIAWTSRGFESPPSATPSPLGRGAETCRQKTRAHLPAFAVAGFSRAWARISRAKGSLCIDTGRGKMNQADRREAGRSSVSPGSANAHPSPATVDAHLDIARERGHWREASEDQLTMQIIIFSIKYDKFTGFFDKLMKSACLVTGCNQKDYLLNLSEAHSNIATKKDFRFPRICPHLPAFARDAHPACAYPGLREKNSRYLGASGASRQSKPVASAAPSISRAVQSFSSARWFSEQIPARPVAFQWTNAGPRALASASARLTSASEAGVNSTGDTGMFT